MKKSRAVLSEKEKLSIKVIKIANSCKSLEELAARLKENDLKPYYRYGKLSGLWTGKRKLRLTTLGVGKEHLRQLTIEQERLDGLAKLRKQKDKDREIER